MWNVSQPKTQSFQQEVREMGIGYNTSVKQDRKWPSLQGTAGQIVDLSRKLSFR